MQKSTSKNINKNKKMSRDWLNLFYDIQERTVFHIKWLSEHPDSVDTYEAAYMKLFLIAEFSLLSCGVDGPLDGLHDRINEAHDYDEADQNVEKSCKPTHDWVKRACMATSKYIIEMMDTKDMEPELRKVLAGWSPARKFVQ
jgi:hypothetical protein